MKLLTAISFLAVIAAAHSFAPGRGLPFPHHRISGVLGSSVSRLEALLSAYAYPGNGHGFSSTAITSLETLSPAVG